MDQDIYAQLLSEKIYNKVTGSVKVSDSEIKTYYNAHKSTYSQAATRDVRHILVNNKKLADTIETQLKSGGELRDAREEVLEGSGLGSEGRQADDLEGPDRCAVRQGRVRACDRQDVAAGAHAVRLAHHPGALRGQAGEDDAARPGDGVDPAAAAADEEERRDDEVGRRHEEGLLQRQARLPLRTSR